MEARRAGSGTDAGGMVELGLTASFNMNWTGWKIFNTIASFVDC